MTTRYAPASTIHRDPTITNYFYSIASNDQLTVKIFCAETYTEKNGNLSYTFQQTYRGKYVTFSILHLIYSIRNVCVILYYAFMDLYNLINDKLLHIHTIQFYILTWFNIKIHFSDRLSVRVSNSDQPVNCAIKFHTRLTCHNLYNYTPDLFTHHHTIIYTHVAQQTDTFFAPACHLPHKISYNTNISQLT